LITEYAQGNDFQTSLGPHFQRPGRTILERHLVDVPEPSSILGDDGGLEKLHRVFFCGKPPFSLFYFIFNERFILQFQVMIYHPSSHPMLQHIPL
jgi:hypothetical protein